MASATANSLELIGRQVELDALAAMRNGSSVGTGRSAGNAGAVIAGQPGVGKTRFGCEALAQARADRCAVETIEGSAAAASVPFAAAAHLLPDRALSSDSPLTMLTAAVDRLAARAARRRLVLNVDDSNLLDDATIALITRLTAVPGVFTIVTVRTEGSVPPAVDALWKDGRAHRIDMQPLTRDETHQMTAAILDAEVAPATLRYYWDVSLGNPLFLRELLLADQEKGMLTLDRGGWHRKRGARGTSPRLDALVLSRLGQLSDDERTVLDTIVVTGPIDLELLTAVAPVQSIELLAVQGILRVRDEGRRATVTLAHPVYGVVLGEHLPRPRRDRVRAELGAVVRRRRDNRPTDLVRLAAWALDVGEQIPSTQLLDAARYAQAAFPTALAERLAAESPIAADVMPLVGTAAAGRRPSEDDLSTAERLVRAAWEADRSVSAGLALSAVLIARGAADEADDVITTLESVAKNSSDRALVARARGSLLFWVLRRPDEATAVLSDAEAGADAESVALLRRMRAGIALNVGRIPDALTLATDLLRGTTPDQPIAVLAAATAAAGLALNGRPKEAIALADRHLGAALTRAETLPEVLGQLLLARIYALRLLGRLDEAGQLATTVYQPAAEHGSVVGMAVFTGVRGEVALEQGRLALATRRFREADVLFGESDPLGYRPKAAAGLATALAQSGDTEGASEVMRSIGSDHEFRFFAAEVLLAEAWCLAADADLPAAARRAADAAARAQAGGLLALEASALHTMVRLGDTQTAADRMQELASSAQSPLIDTYAAHAAAWRSGDGSALEAVAERFAGLGIRLLAAEAFAQATSAYDAASQPADASRAATRSDELRAHCEGAATPALKLATRAPQLTAREREVAWLAADGLATKLIAERLVVSSRTVESHLYRVYAKLGVHRTGANWRRCSRRTRDPSAFQRRTPACGGRRAIGPHPRPEFSSALLIRSEAKHAHSPTRALCRQYHSRPPRRRLLSVPRETERSHEQQIAH